MAEEKDEGMRLDKFLKVSRLIKRRTVAADAADAGRMIMNTTKKENVADMFDYI